MEKPSPTITITNDDLLTNKYPIDVLVYNIRDLDIKTLLRTQRLTAAFCIDYIFNEEYASCVEDTYICLGDVLAKQPHLSESDFDWVAGNRSSGEP